MLSCGAGVHLLNLVDGAHCDPLCKELTLQISQIIPSCSHLVVPLHHVSEVAPHLTELS